MAYAVIELLTLNLALTPPFRQTLVMRPPFFFRPVCRCVGVVALLHFLLALCGWKNANVLPKALANLCSYFNNFLFSTSCKMLICWIAILFSFINRSFCGIFSLMKTAFRFSIFDKQISSLIVA